MSLNRRLVVDLQSTQADGTHEGQASSVTVSPLRQGAYIDGDQSTIVASATGTVQLHNPGALVNTDDCYVVRTGNILTGVPTTTTTLRLVTSPTYNVGNGTWDVDLTNVAGVDITLADNDRLVLTGDGVGGKDLIKTSQVTDQEAGTQQTFPTGTQGGVGFYAVTDADCDLKFSGATYDTKYIVDLPVEPRKEIRPEEFGALGDNSADDTVAIQRAIDFAGGVEGGAVVRFRENKHYLFSALTMRTGVSLIGGGAVSTQLTHTGTGVAIDRGSASPVTHWTIRDIQFTFTSSTTTALDFERFALGRIQDCVLDGGGSFTGTILQFGNGEASTGDTAYWNTVDNCDFINGSARTGTAIKITQAGNEQVIFRNRFNAFKTFVDATGTACNQCKMAYNAFENNQLDATGFAIDLGGTGHHIVIGNRFENVGVAVHIDSAINVNRCQLVANFYSGVTDHTFLNGSSNVDYYRSSDNGVDRVRSMELVDGDVSGMLTDFALNGKKLDFQGKYENGVYADHAFIVGRASTPEAGENGDFGSMVLRTDNGSGYLKKTATSAAGWEEILTVGSVTQDVDRSYFFPAPAKNTVHHIGGHIKAIDTDDSATVGWTVVTGISRLMFVMEDSGTPVNGTLNVAGTSVSRTTGAESSTNEDITVDATSTDSSSNPVSGVDKWDFDNVYITDDWYTGTVTMSTADDLDFDLIDTYAITYDQYGDSAGLTITAIDVTAADVDAATADLYAYVQAFTKVSGKKYNLKPLGDIEMAEAKFAANLPYRIRRTFSQALDGSDGEGIFTSIWFDPTTTSTNPFSDVTLWIRGTKALVSS